MKTTIEFNDFLTDTEETLVCSGVNKEKNSIELTFGLHQGVSLQTLKLF